MNSVDPNKIANQQSLREMRNTKMLMMTPVNTTSITSSLNFLNLPPSILVLFAPRKPIPFLKPILKDHYYKLYPVSNYIDQFSDPPPPFDPNFKVPETKRQKIKRLKEAAKERREKAIAADLPKWNAKDNSKIKGNPECTLFVGRLARSVTEEELEKEMSNFGPVKSLTIPRYPRNGKSCGYAFVEFETLRDMKRAMRDADGLKIKGKRIVTDTERGRTEKNWKPHRFGGGVKTSRSGITSSSHHSSSSGYASSSSSSFVSQRSSTGGSGSRDVYNSEVDRSSTVKRRINDVDGHGEEETDSRKRRRSSSDRH